MDNETLAPDAKTAKPETARGLPKGGTFPTVAANESTSQERAVKESVASPQALVAVPKGQAPRGEEADERGGVFRQLVADDGDITGLVAYSIYKQNKLDWLHAFETAKGRKPTADELDAYIVGEGTPRRTATYRHLAEATLAGNGPDVGGTAVAGARRDFRRGGFLDRRAPTPGLMLAYGLVVVLLLVIVWMVAHYTMTSR